MTAATPPQLPPWPVYPMRDGFARDRVELGWSVAYALRDENTDFGHLTREQRIARVGWGS